MFLNLKKSVFGFFALAILLFSGIMLTKVLPYLRFEHALNFLGTKTDAILGLWHFQVAFYVHITSSLVVMSIGIFQFIPKFLAIYPQVHRWVGRIYVIGILVLAAPSGLILGIYANGGLSPRVAFCTQSVLWFGFTFLAYYFIRKRAILFHQEMMIRSFALTLAAMSLRLESYALYYLFETKPIETYLTVSWLSWVGNLLVAEIIIYYKRYYQNL